MVIRDVHMAQQIAVLMQRIRQRVFFDVHMIEIADDLHVLQTVLFDIATRVSQGVDHVILIAVQRLQVDGCSGARRHLIQPAQGGAYGFAVTVQAAWRGHRWQTEGKHPPGSRHDNALSADFRQRFQNAFDLL